MYLFVESFFSRKKIALVHHKVYRTRSQASADVLDLIEVSVNSIRRHLTIKYVSLVKFEEALSAQFGDCDTRSSPPLQADSTYRDEPAFRINDGFELSRYCINRVLAPSM